MKIISLIGFSGSGKTYFIINAIKLLKLQLDYEVACIKNVDQHNIDKEGKDSFEFTKAGAMYSIIKNQFNEYALFFKSKLDIKELIEWISKGPFKVDLIFIEGFRNLNYPTVLCVNNFNEIDQQLSENVRMISGVLISKNQKYKEYKGIPLKSISENFDEFLEIFEIYEIKV